MVDNALTPQFWALEKCAVKVASLKTRLHELLVLEDCVCRRTFRARGALAIAPDDSHSTF